MRQYCAVAEFPRAEKPIKINNIIASDGTTAKQFNANVGNFPDRSESEFQDAATQNWGTYWRMPTHAELNNLLSSSYCTVEYVKTASNEGLKITGNATVYNANDIFLPAAGYGDGPNLEIAGSDGCYWSSTQDSGNASRPFLSINGCCIFIAIDCTTFSRLFYKISFPFQILRCAFDCKFIAWYCNYKSYFCVACLPVKQ